MIDCKGIDERVIKCSCNNENCRQGGISFDENILRFHFLDYRYGSFEVDQVTKSMILNKETAQELINELKNIVNEKI